MRIYNNKRTASIEGVVKFQRSVEPGLCVCCPRGEHISHRYIEVEHEDSPIFPGVAIDSVHDFVTHALVLMPGIEGRQIRITIDVIPTMEESMKRLDDEFFDEEYR